ncbi:IclR family transcriptional regulator [Sphingomonas naphthae]|uniref:IclR family transcriptional regulator n=1 Tax=Sphingomonas naphthae TaxID=1813468 RepID=A0ABY7TMP5_9SPHN|nr:IclR family transcriptional regulator [Sphingomonas naphthae]WCT73499.1 IclR family transcriptional regulator [Sphingomonas naphthae]
MSDPLHYVPRPDQELAKAVEVSKAPAISRAAAVLRLLGKSEQPLGLQAIARELGLVPSTCLYVLRALVAEEFVAFDPDTKRYALQAGVLTLARHWLRRDRFNELAQPILNRISRQVDATVIGVHIVGIDHMIIVATSQAGNNFQLSAQVGSRFPALISATGRCIAAFGDHSEAELEAKFRTLRWDDGPSFETWLTQVRETRAQGFAVDEGAYITGVTVVAAPVWKVRGRLSHALVVAGLTSAVRRAGLEAVQQELLRSATWLSRQLCGEQE